MNKRRQEDNLSSRDGMSCRSNLISFSAECRTFMNGFQLQSSIQMSNYYGLKADNESKYWENS